MAKKNVGNISLFLVLMVMAVMYLPGSPQGSETMINVDQIIQMVCEKIRSYYPSEEIASTVIGGLKGNLSSGKYNHYADSPAVLASVVTADMEKLSRDLHLDLLFDPEMVADMKVRKEAGEESAYTGSQVEASRLTNFGFKTLKIMDGNVGYLDLQVFFAANYAGDTAVAAMGFFANCDALIIDLRNNGGGWDSMVNLLLSYFIDPEEEVVLKIMQSTVDKTYYPSMSMAYVPGKKMNIIPVMILTSRSTASAAEAFAFRMKQLNSQVSIVGETTAGAENPVDHQIVGNHFVLKIPCYRVVYSKTEGGWERTGVRPDIPVDSRKAMETAYLQVLKNLAALDKNGKKLEVYQWAIDGLEARKNPLKLKKAILRNYAGRYGNASVRLEEGNLYYQYKGRSKNRLVPIKADYFLVEGADHYRIRFQQNPGRPLILKVIFNDGYTIVHTKDQR